MERQTKMVMDVEAIRAIIPHRYPFLLVDRILELEPSVRAVGLKNVTANENFFQGHFPGQAIMPGVLIVEAMAQVGGVMMMALPDTHNKLTLLAGLDNVRFRRPVVPGDALITEVTLTWFRRDIGRVRTIARVNGEIAAEADMTFALVDQDEFREQLRDS